MNRHLLIWPLVLLLLGVGIVSAQRGAMRVSARKATPEEVEARKQRWNAIPLDVTFPDVDKLRREAAAAAEQEKAAAQVEWAKFLGPKVIEKEVERIVAASEDPLKNVKFFMARGVKEATVQQAMLSTLFHISHTHSGNVKWKDKALGARDMAMEGLMGAYVFGDEDGYELCKQTIEVASKLAAGEQAEVPEGDDGEKSWADELAPLTAVMRRMEDAHFNKLYKWTANGNEFEANKQDIAHEAAILATLGQIILDKSYALASEGDFRKFASTLRDNSLTVVEAVKENNFDKASAAVRDNNLQCSACHQAYR